MLSGGRLVLGLGIGWLPHEYAAAGVPFARRGARMEEYLRCLHALWTQDPVEFAGEFYTVPRSHTGLPPVQRPHPPVLLGGAAPEALRRAGRLADGWISSTKQEPALLASAVELVRAGAREAGREEDRLRILVRVVAELLDDEPGGARPPFTGTRDQLLDDLVRLKGQGATEVLVDLNFSPRVGTPHVDAAAAVKRPPAGEPSLHPRQAADDWLSAETRRWCSKHTGVDWHDVRRRATDVHRAVRPWTRQNVVSACNPTGREPFPRTSPCSCRCSSTRSCGTATTTKSRTGSTGSAAPARQNSPGCSSAACSPRGAPFGALP